MNVKWWVTRFYRKCQCIIDAQNPKKMECNVLLGQLQLQIVELENINKCNGKTVLSAIISPHRSFHFRIFVINWNSHDIQQYIVNLKRKFKTNKLEFIENQ